MAFNKANQTNIDKSDLADYPNGQIKDNDGTNDGTPVARITMSDMFETFDKLMRLAGISYNAKYDNESNGYQYIQALQALAGKNDLIQPVTAGSAVIGGVTTPILILANVKIETLLLNEFLVGQAAADYASQTQIQGSTLGTYLNVSANLFKTNDYLLIQKTSGGLAIQSLATSGNFSALATLLGFLKAADNPTTIAGTSVTTAVTPASLLAAFTQFVTDPTSAIPYLATPTTPGLLSAADKIAINSFAVRNIGWISGVDPGGGTVGSTFAVSGNISSATISVQYGKYFTVSGIDVGDGTLINVVMQNAMDNLNYKVRFQTESLGTISADSNATNIVFKTISTTQFQFVIREAASGVQSLKIHIEVIQLI